MKEFDNTIEFDATKFTWELGCGYAEASQLGLKPGEVPYVRSYSNCNSYDASMTLVNPKRGTKMEYVLEKSIVSPNSWAVYGWKFRAKGVNSTVTIYND